MITYIEQYGRRYKVQFIKDIVTISKIIPTRHKILEIPMRLDTLKAGEIVKLARIKLGTLPQENGKCSGKNHQR